MPRYMQMVRVEIIAKNREDADTAAFELDVETDADVEATVMAKLVGPVTLLRKPKTPDILDRVAAAAAERRRAAGR